MGASRVLTMQIAGESLLNAADLQLKWKTMWYSDGFCIFLHDLVLPKPQNPPCLFAGLNDQDGVAIVVWLVFYNLMKGRG